MTSFLKRWAQVLSPEVGKTGMQSAAPPARALPPLPSLSESVARGVHLADRYAGMNGRALPVRAPVLNPLEQYFDAHTEGLGIWKFRHYFDIYHRHFQKFIGREVHVLEIGVASGGSLGMWQHYFGPRSRIYGVDIKPECKAFESESVKIFLGDQADRQFWKRFKSEVPAIDIVIDDGLHWPEHQMVSIEELLPHVRSGGVYLCEDLFDDPHPFNQFACGLAGRMHKLGKASSGLTEFHHSVETNPVRACFRGVHLYPQVVVVEMNDEPNTRFEAPMHGTKFVKF